MNPPSAIHGAMSRDRKPFTYTPGGLDLSEIKSERMAKRLMRNAMNEGVPQLPPQQVQSPPTTSMAVPNFNCLPVQVFPAFNLPANPKSLLRTRSNPVSREAPLQRQPPPPSQFVNNTGEAGVGKYNTFNKNTSPYPQINNNRPTSMYDYGTPGNVQPYVNYGNDSNNATFPEISYDAQYFQTPKINNYTECAVPSNIIKTESVDDKEINNYTNAQFEEPNVPTAVALENKDFIIDIKPVTASTVPEVSAMPNQEDVGFNDDQREVTMLKKEVKKETNSEEHNGDQNGDAEAEMTIKLPSSKSAAKTETKVEVSKKTLPDGSIEEIKKTITKTTIDGKTEIKTKTETTIIPKDDDYEDEEEEVEEEEEENGEVEKEVTDGRKQIQEKTLINNLEQNLSETRENGQSNIKKTEERSETTTTSTKRVVIVQEDKKEEEEEDEEEIEEEDTEEPEPVTVVVKTPSPPSPPQKEVNEFEETEVEDKEEDKKVNIKNEEERSESVPPQKVETEEEVEEEEDEITKTSINKPESNEEEENVEEEEEYEEAEEEVQEEKLEVKGGKESIPEKVIKTDKETTCEKENETEKEETSENPVEDDKLKSVESKTTEEDSKPAALEIKIPIKIESDEKHEAVAEEIKQQASERSHSPYTEKLETPEPKLPLREPSVPLEKVEDVEIKPLSAGNFVKKSLTETTEIITGTGEKPSGLLTEYNRTENIVTVNRTTKTLDYENSAPQTIPTLTYFTPHIEKFPPVSPASRPYQPVYPSEPTSERRHSLLLERLSVERQIPTNEIYQNTQQYSKPVEQQNQWSQEPRVEILNIENVKPSTITNQQWYQQTKKEDVTYNNVAPVAPPVAPSWTQPKPQPQPVYQPPPQPTYQAQPPPQPTYQAQPPAQPTYQPPQPHPVYQSQTQYQPQAQPQYQSYTENLQQNSSSQQNTYSTYTPKPNNWTSNTSNLDTLSTQNQYSYKDSTNSYQTQQRSSSYVPPPWEQDSTYVVDNSQNYYQPPPQNTLTPDHNQSWKPTPPASKSTKPSHTAYIPPKPNQSFVKHVTIAEPPKQPGRKTYYSEYERRYISVPESTYIPSETKLPTQIQTQPDPSPAYYYDNNEPAETVEHQWRKELREFTEKAQTQTYPENVKPPWEMETKTTQNYSYKDTQSQYAKTQETTYTATPTWSQTLRPQSWRERSFESEFVSQEWPKTNTLGRGRPLSSHGKEPVPERTRGVSVDRYNPNNYQSPVSAEHPPVQTFTHNPPAPHATGYHNPNVPAYHARASAEPREQPVYQQPRAWREARASPFQSRSFKYLQWITGTED